MQARTRARSAAPRGPLLAAVATVALACSGSAHAQCGGLSSDRGVGASGASTALYVVTPATPQRWIANQGAFLLVFKDPGGDSTRVSYLRRWAKDDRFDLAKRAQSAVLEAIAARGRLTLPLAVSRPEQIQPSPLARDQVPQTALRGEILDVAVEWFGVSSSGPFAKYHPFVRISWRVVDARGGIVRPTQVVQYHEVRGSGLPKAETIDTDPECAWESIEAMSKERPRVWACFNGALDAVAKRVAESVVPVAPAAPPSGEG